MGHGVKIAAVLAIFFIMTSGGIILVVAGEREVGNMMITAGVSFIMGVGVMIIQGNADERKKRDSNPPPFHHRRKNTPVHYTDKPFHKKDDER